MNQKLVCVGQKRVSGLLNYKALLAHPLHIDWHLLKGHITPDNVVYMLPGELKDNCVQIPYLLSHFRNPEFSYASFMNELFADSESDLDFLEAPGWTRSEWYCLDCLEIFIRSRILPWCIKWWDNDGTLRTKILSICTV